MSSRTLTAGVTAELGGQVVRPAFFASIVTAVGTVYLWTGIGTITWNGQNWVGVGKFGSVSSVPESIEVSAEGIMLTLSGIPADLLSTATTDLVQGKAVSLYLVFFDDAGAIIAGDQPLSFQGRVDRVEIQEGGESSTITVAVESKLIDLQRSRDRRLTDADQQQEYPGDLGFAFVASLQERNLNWGGGTNPIPLGPGGGGGDTGGGYGYDREL